MIVLDASAVLAALLHRGEARKRLATDQVHVPHLVDAEVASVLRRQVAHRVLTAAQSWSALDAWRRLGVTRHPVHPLLQRVWGLRDNLTAYDASYVALAETLGCDLMTADARMARSPGLRCSVTVVPR